MARTTLEIVRQEMADVITANRYGGGTATKKDLLEKISHWRSELQDVVDGLAADAL